jgi:hypothetical protein
LGEVLGPCWEYAYYGGVVPPEIDYMDVGEVLYRGLRVDYTYLHPEVLAGRCEIDGKKLVLNNKENREEYSVLMVPGGTLFLMPLPGRFRSFTGVAGPSLPPAGFLIGQRSSAMTGKFSRLLVRCSPSRWT